MTHGCAGYSMKEIPHPHAKNQNRIRIYNTFPSFCLITT